MVEMKDNFDNERLTGTVDEAADLLGIGRSLAYEAVRAGQIPAFRVGRRWIVCLTALKKKIEGRE